MSNQLIDPEKFKWLHGNIIELRGQPGGQMFVKLRVPNNVTISIKQSLEIFAGSFKKEWPGENISLNGFPWQARQAPFYYLSGYINNVELFNLFQSIMKDNGKKEIPG
jgi:hypothetical protein